MLNHHREIPRAGRLPVVCALALVALAPLPGHAEVVINEIFFAADVDHDRAELQHEFVELYNAGTQAVHLAGWELRDSTSLLFVFPSLTLPPGAFLTVFSGSADGLLEVDDDPTDGSARLIGTDFWAAADLSNAGDAVQLYDDAVPLPGIRDFVYFDSSNLGDAAVDGDAVAAGLWKAEAAIDTLSSSTSRGRAIALRIDGASPLEADPAADAEDQDWSQYDTQAGATPGGPNHPDVIHADGFEAR